MANIEKHALRIIEMNLSHSLRVLEIMDKRQQGKTELRDGKVNWLRAMLNEAMRFTTEFKENVDVPAFQPPF